MRKIENRSLIVHGKCLFARFQFDNQFPTIYMFLCNEYTNEQQVQVLSSFCCPFLDSKPSFIYMITNNILMITMCLCVGVN